jgi:hypothetical protein
MNWIYSIGILIAGFITLCFVLFVVAMIEDFLERNLGKPPPWLVIVFLCTWLAVLTIAIKESLFK